MSKLVALFICGDADDMFEFGPHWTEAQICTWIDGYAAGADHDHAFYFLLDDKAHGEEGDLIEDPAVLKGIEWLKGRPTTKK